MASHVLLAACRPDEDALEDPYAKGASGGLFTTALIEGLRRSSLHDTSYTKLFETLNLKNDRQHPQCEGVNKDRLLFSVNTLRDGKTTFKVFHKGNRLCVSAGSIHGIVVGTEFSVRSPAQTLVLRAKKVGASETMLEGYHSMTKAEATVSHWHHPTLRMHSPVQQSGAHVTVVPDTEPAEVALRQKGLGKWELERFDPLISSYADRIVHFDADTNRMKDILEAIANFNSYLYRSDGAAPSFAGKVKMRLNCIKLVQREYGPVGDDLLDVPISSASGVDVKEAVITDLEARYGFTLENYSDVDLFPYFFYFDPSDYSIQVRSPSAARRRNIPKPTFAHRLGILPHPPLCSHLSNEGRKTVQHRCSHSDMARSARIPSSSTSRLDVRPTRASSRFS